jgi:stearoyl-CoA desaturase (delta-9 desaturase)
MITRVLKATTLKAAAIAVLHGLVVAALIIGTTSKDWLVFAAIYPFAAIGVGVAMHRYFAHQAFRTSRWFQFVLALMASLSFGNALHFAGKHRLHHRFSDGERDCHSPGQGAWQCWIGSILDSGYTTTEIEHGIGKYLKYPELAWLYRNSWLPATLLCLVLYLTGGLSMMAIGGCLSAVLLLHQSSAVNYFCHCRGAKRFLTRDDSRNNAIVAILTFGEGWHNNHHRFPRSARAGLYWWEIDMFYWVIWFMERAGLIWDVNRVPRSKLEKANVTYQEHISNQAY